MKKSIIIGLLLFLSFNGFAQQYRSPLDIALHLSANCGELRNNHFHSGIDIKTQSVTGKPIYSIEDGYVSRISVSPAGYGLALYIDHPSTGHTSVYGHLESYNPRIAAYTKEKQYEQESFRVDLKLTPGQIPVKKGEVVAYSGNTGGSGGPHLHFEIRETKTERVLDPLIYYKKMITDTKSPDIRGIAAYPVPGRGVVNGMSTPLRQSVSLLKNGSYSQPKQSIEAWGLIGLGIKAYDRMDNNSNIYGVKMATLSVDGKQVFKYDIDYFTFDQTRMLNTFTDFADWRLNKSFFMQSFVEPGNALPFYTAENNGYININEERPYKISYELQDIYGNKTSYKYTITGKKQNITIPSGCSLVMVWNDDNRYISEPFSLIIHKGNLYNDICFTLSQTNSAEYFSNIFTVNNTPIALDKSGEVRIKMTSDPLSNKRQYGIVQLTGGKTS
ncbi:M23 family metallopeptidase, partial [Dysgonomonas sp. OttesenSCG-928-M03]|nr:M23 family metallopeptidase [Dysgonomonas sp. OttesenSCG-928-M03]